MTENRTRFPSETFCAAKFVRGRWKAGHWTLHTDYVGVIASTGPKGFESVDEESSLLEGAKRKGGMSAS